MLSIIYGKRDSFNSQPRKEADLMFRSVCGLHLRFNSQPRKEADRTMVAEASSARSFNSQPRKEADRVIQVHLLISFRFNSQPRKEADSNFEQKYLLRNCIFYNYCIYYFLYLSCIQLFTHFFSINSPIFRCECPRKSCVLSFRTIISRYL